MVIVADELFGEYEINVLMVNLEANPVLNFVVNAPSNRVCPDGDIFESLLLDLTAHH